MNISEVSSSLENISLPPDQKKAILQLIDSKINNDMKEVIAKLNELEKPRVFVTRIGHFSNHFLADLKLVAELTT